MTEHAMIGMDGAIERRKTMTEHAMIGSASPVREPGEGPESWNARMAEHRDIERFEHAVRRRLIARKVQRHVRFHLEAPIEPGAGKDEPGVWVPLQIFVSFEDAGVDPDGWEDG